MPLLSLLACWCDTTPTQQRTTWTSGEAHAVVDDTDIALEGATLDYLAPDGWWRLRTDPVDLLLGTCESSAAIVVEWDDDDPWAGVFVAASIGRLSGTAETTWTGAELAGETAPAELEPSEEDAADLCWGSGSPVVAVSWAFDADVSSTEDVKLACF
jgi:hypothetical protein